MYTLHTLENLFVANNHASNSETYCLFGCSFQWGISLSCVGNKLMKSIPLTNHESVYPQKVATMYDM